MSQNYFVYLIQELIESAADSLGRVDVLCEAAPEAIETALRLVAVAEIAALAPQPINVELAHLAAADGDALHDAGLTPALVHWRVLLGTEEGRLRSGAALNAQRFAIVAPALTTYPERARLEAIWRGRDRAEPVIAHALDAAAWSPDDAFGEATAALMLCGDGRASRARLLPAADVPRAARAAALAEWRRGDRDAWLSLGFEAVARRAGALQRSLAPLRETLVAEDDRMESLGRAAITARRALSQLRDQFVTTVPRLAKRLALSRPAAGDALERLLDAGITREITGRARDRVFAYRAAYAVAESLQSTKPPS